MKNNLGNVFMRVVTIFVIAISSVLFLQFVVNAAEQESDIEGFVTRFYQECLGREPDTGGLNHWVDALNSGEMSGADLAWSFIYSDEFQSMNTTDDEYLEVLYLAFFNRESDQGGYNYWLSLLAEGTDRATVLEGFISSQEFITLCDNYGIEATSSNSEDMTVEGFVTRFYQECLGREPDTDGLNNWVDALNLGEMSGADLAWSFIYSDEFQNMNTTDDEYLEVLYQAFFNREPDEGGYDNWLSLLTGGTDREIVLEGFLNSQEFLDLCESYGISATSTQEPVTPAYDLSDLQGTWKVHSLASGSGAPWWERATVTIASDATFTAETTESDGSEDYLSGTFSISSDGEVTMSGNSSPFLGNMDSGKSVMVWTDTWSSGSPGTTEIKIATNVDATYTTADLAGTWKVHSLASGQGAPWWERATVTIASDGTFTAETTESDGNEDYLSGTFSISSDGEVTMSGNSPPFLGNMDSSKSVMVWTDTWSSGSPGTTEIKIATNVDATYTTADLAGTWKVHSLASGQGAPWWERGIVTIASDGSYTASTTQSDGGEKNSSGTLSISSDGEITDGTLIGNMDANKTVMIWTDTWISESPGTTEISVLVKELE